MSSRAPLEVVYFGTPEVAVPPLGALLNDARFRVLAAVTQTDKPAGRGHKLQASPVKNAALEHGLQVFQPVSLKNRAKGAGLHEFLESIRCDFFVVVAYGKIIPGDLLARPEYGSVNIHFSLLPRWRGAAPLQRAILACDSETGVSLMQMEETLDTGTVYLEERLPIAPEDTTGSLAAKLSHAGALMLPDALVRIASGELTGRPQPEAGVTYAEKLSPADFQILWSEPAAITAAKIQAAAPSPGARSTYRGEPVKLFSARRSPQLAHPLAEPGTIVESNSRELLVQAGDGTLVAIQELQFPNRKRLAVCEIVKSMPLPAGSRFGESS